ncbi:MAG TPA: hypothetical protein VMT00_04420 [Thermoanaerobaculia bacterium]|nr:hypothetical protein [Thermoanaerobaculia bacterium]
MDGKRDSTEREYPLTFEDARESQMTIGLNLTPEQRLAWLERRRREVAEWCIAAENARPLKDVERGDSKG